MNQKPRVTLVRGPIVSTVRAANNEATPCIGLAYIAGYLRQHGYDATIVDAIGAGLNQYWPLDDHPGYIVLTSAKGTSGGASNYGCGFLPTAYGGVPFRSTGDPVLYLSSPGGIASGGQRAKDRRARVLKMLDPSFMSSQAMTGQRIQSVRRRGSAQCFARFH